MAFFGVTQLGYQDPVREHVKEPVFTPQYHYRSGEFVKVPFDKLPPIKKDTREPSNVPINQTSGYGAGPQGSYEEMMRLRAKHTRNTEEPIDIYRRPVHTAHDIADWRRDEPVNINQPWTKTPKFPCVNSEMTRFVKQMALTNREFSLF